MKIISAKKLVSKEYKTMDLSDEWKQYVGELELSFIGILWGPSFAGKSSFLNAFVKELARVNSVLYVALEEGFSGTAKRKAIRNGLGEMPNLKYANHETTFEKLMEYLKKKRSPRIVIIDSLQYIAMTYIDFKHMKEAFPKKSFIFISHAEGKKPDGKTGKKIHYDAGLKIYVEGYIAFIESRYGEHKNYCIWEGDATEGAKKYWGSKLFKKHLNK